MPSPTQAFLEQFRLMRELKGREAERGQLNTLRDLQIKREVADFENRQAGSKLEELKRQLETKQTESKLQALPQQQATQQAELSAREAQAIDDEAQARLDAGEPAPKIIEDYTKRGIVPEGTKAFKVPLDEERPEFGTAWAIQAPGQEPEIFNKELLKEQRQFKMDMAKLRGKSRTGVTPEPRKIGKADVAITTKAVEALSIGEPWEDEIDSGSKIAFSKDVADKAEAIQARAKAKGQIIGEDEARKQAYDELKVHLKRKTAMNMNLPEFLPDFMKEALSEYVYAPGEKTTEENTLPTGLSEKDIEANMKRGYSRQEIIDLYNARQTGQ